MLPDFLIELFDENGIQIGVGDIEFYPIENRLVKEYKWDTDEAKLFSTFLLKMVNPNPAERTTAYDLLTDEWLNS